MQGQGQQQAYDRGITIFSPDGRLYQVEYAREAVKRGSPSIGVRTSEGIILLVNKRIPSPLVESSSIEKVFKTDSHIGIASAGHVADARQLIDFARRMAQVNRLRYGEPLGVESLTNQITDHIQQYTQVGGARPFGVSLLIGGITDETPRLYETDPSGTAWEWEATAIGENRGEIKEYLEAHYEADLKLEDGIELAFRALGSVNDDSLAADEMGAAKITTADSAFRSLDQSEIESYLETFDLLATDDEETEAEDEDDEPDENGNEQ